MDRRRFLVGTSSGLFPAFSRSRDEATRAGLSDDRTVRSSVGSRQADDFGSFVDGLRASLSDLGVSVSASASCLGYGILLLTTRSEEPNDDAFDEELAVVADEYLEYVERTETPPDVGLIVEVYRTMDAAEERGDRFATYSVTTESASRALQTGDEIGFWHGVLQSVSPPVWAVDGAGGDPSLEITNHEPAAIDGGDDEFGIEAWIENRGNGRSGDVEVLVNWYDEAGEYLGADTANLRTLRSGETWIARVYPQTVNPADVEEYEMILVYDLPKFGTPPGLEVAESDLHVNGEARVHGALSNRTGEELFYVEAIARVFDGDGRVLGGDWASGSSIAADETWRFDLSYVDDDRSRLDAIERYEVVPLGQY